MRTLIAVTTCHARRAYADAQRATWAAGPNRPYLFKGLDAEVVFFVGGGSAEREDEVILDVDDSYRGLPAKVKVAMRWALDNSFDSVLKLDDDVYVVPSRLPDYRDYTNQYEGPGTNYVGNFRTHNGNYPYDYASGFCYWLGRSSVEAIAAAPLTDDTMEDRWVGTALALARAKTYDEKRFCCSYPGIEEGKFLWGSPIGKTHIAFAQYPIERMYDLHHWYMIAFINNRGS